MDEREAARSLRDAHLHLFGSKLLQPHETIVAELKELNTAGWTATN